MKVSEVIQLYGDALEDLYEASELAQIIFLVLEYVKGFSKIDLVLRKEEQVSEQDERKLKEILEELERNKPVQYIIGHAWFYGMKLKVNENVLIPRQETEELVDWIVEESRIKNRDSRLTVLDICTGSGCIAVSLSKNLPEAVLTALDISEKALDVARENAESNQTDVQFVQVDILNTIRSFPVSGFDLIVSNPPYVMASERDKMKAHVLNHEPHLALFVPDSDPLIFYRRIADFALENLKPQGKLYVEINEMKGNEVVELLIDRGFSEVVLKKDLNGKDRMVRAVLEI